MYTTGCSSQTSNLLIVLCEEAQKVLVNISPLQITYKGGGDTHVTGGDHDYSDINQVLCCLGNIFNANYDDISILLLQ